MDWEHLGAVERLAGGHFTYATGDSAQVAAEEYAALLEAEGWKRDTVGTGSTRRRARSPKRGRKRRSNVRISIAGPTSEPRRFDTLVPAAQTKVDLSFDGQR